MNTSFPSLYLRFRQWWTEINAVNTTIPEAVPLIVSTILDFLGLGSRSKAMDNWTMGFPQAKSPMCLVECVEDGTKFIFIQEVLHSLACPSQILTLQSSNQKQNWKRYVHVSQIGPDEIHVRRCHLPNPPLATPHSANSSMATSD